MGKMSSCDLAGFKVFHRDEFQNVTTPLNVIPLERYNYLGIISEQKSIGHGAKSY
jgi:hypothetical protein